MRIRRTLSPLLGLSLTLAGCAAETDEARTEAERPGTIAAPAADPAAVRRLIDSTNVLLADAIHKEDAAAHSAMYTSDAIVMMQNTPAAPQNLGQKSVLTCLSAESCESAVHSINLGDVLRS